MSAAASPAPVLRNRRTRCQRGPRRPRFAAQTSARVVVLRLRRLQALRGNHPTARVLRDAHRARHIFLGLRRRLSDQARAGRRLRIAELGAGSAEKTRLLLKAAAGRQGAVVYEPVDVSASALDGAKRRIEREIPAVTVAPRVMDYTRWRRSPIPFGSDGPGREPPGALHRIEHWKF